MQKAQAVETVTKSRFVRKNDKHRFNVYRTKMCEKYCSTLGVSTDGNSLRALGQSRSVIECCTMVMVDCGLDDVGAVTCSA